jgi:integrase
MYNEEVKNRFLNEYDNEGTQATIKSIFTKTASTEKTLGKDLYNFSLDDIAAVFPELKPKVPSTAHSKGRFIKLYISWAIEHGYRTGNLNPLNGVEKEWFVQFVDKTKKIHFNEDEFFEIVESLQNAQDQAFISLVFEGVLGQSFSELQQLNYNHINWNTNEIKIHDENGEYLRTIIVSNRVMRYLDNAYNQFSYFTLNEKTSEFNERELVKSEYIFQNTKSPRIEEGKPVSQAVFYNRIKNIKAETDLDYLTPNAIKQSGMIKMAVDLVTEKVSRGEEAKLNYKDVWFPIGEKYNYATFDNNGEVYYNTNLLKEFISITNIKSLYNLDVTI